MWPIKAKVSKITDRTNLIIQSIILLQKISGDLFLKNISTNIYNHSLSI
jgi:hypothetical protein